MSQMNNKRPRGTRRLTEEQRRRILERRRREQQKKRLMILIPSLAALVVVVVLAFVITLPGRNAERHDVLAMRTPEPVVSEAAVTLGGEIDPEETMNVEPEGELDDEEISVPTAEPVPVETPEPTDNPNPYVPEGGVFVYDDAYVAAVKGKITGPDVVADLSKVDPNKADRWPKANDGYLPLLYKANTTENIIAITVDDCNQAENLRQIVQCALDNNGQLTIFPIGQNVMKENIGSIIKWAWENGMEIENHTYTHAGMYHYDDERMTNEMWYQSAAVSSALGVNYQEHFFRPKGGDERNDQRVHAYAAQMGMQGVAIWTQSGSTDSVGSLLNNLAPGRIYLFHTTDKDLSKLLDFIPAATLRGYRLVTLNEMFGLPDNETSDLSTLPEKPDLEAFKVIPVQLKKTSYIRAAAVLQKRLIELGWMSGEADGIYGQSSYNSIGYFQVAADLSADGIAGAATQIALFADDAPAATSANKKKVAAKMGK